MQRIFVAGNPLVREDALALKVACRLGKKLKGIRFEEIGSLSELENIPKELTLLDVAEGIKKVERVTDLGRLQKMKLVSLHDFDIGTELILLKKIGKIKKFAIIAIPANYQLGKAVEEARELLELLV